MAFNGPELDVDGNPYLVDLIDLDEEKNPLEVSTFVFSDGSEIKFPPGFLFPSAPFLNEHGQVMQLRVRAMPPLVNGKQPPMFLIPMGCTKRHVEKCLERAIKGV